MGDGEKGYEAKKECPVCGYSFQVTVNTNRSNTDIVVIDLSDYVSHKEDGVYYLHDKDELHAKTRDVAEESKSWQDYSG